MTTKVQIVPLNEMHLEMVRIWRNADEIRQQMEYTALISPQQQLNWYHSLNPETNYYFVIQCNNTNIGLTQINQIDWVNKHANCGLFIAQKEYTGLGVSLAASIQLLDLAFFKLKLNYLTAKVKNTNLAAIAYNHQLGFTLKQSLNSQFNKYILTAETYSSVKAQLQELSFYI
jgi:RimJ/RimL family protein N-acetyltransferase